MGYLRTAVIAPVLLCVSWASAALAADRNQIETFLKVTGFDIAIGSISDMAARAPDMLGMPPGSFGADWTRLAEEVFAEDILLEMALDMLEPSLEDELLSHGMAFYASELGQRFVEVENAAHLTDDMEKQADGERYITAMEAAGDQRVELYRRMQAAIDPQGTGVKALQELQVRFLLAAAQSGVISLRLDEEGLRAALREGEAEIGAELRRSGIRFSAYTYQSFSVEEVRTYTEALEHPDMQLIYELLNAVHNAVMIRRFEVLAWRMAELHPVQEL